MKTIEVTGLTKDYGNGKGIFDVSFSVDKGEVVGFLGANGAGKTSTIRHLMGFSKPESGKASIMGKDCFKDASLIQENIGYLPGEIAFMDNMTGHEFIKFMADMKKIKDSSMADRLIKYLELDTSVRIKKMSKGMKQKLGIVIAFMQDAPILILDEPTSGLDPLMQNKFVELIKKSKENGKTILMSSHIFEEVENTCDRIVMIKNGKIVADRDLEIIRNDRNKHYEIIFAEKNDAEIFKKRYPESKIDENRIIMTGKDDINRVIKDISEYKIEDITIRHQTLEEVFMKYYGGEK
ncbi:ABC transporter ATP-binding protein [Peptacetobacter hominis]|uniref:ABC transporter ATP-binding protein n=1 Tax=Peptacetobacter hominis TaxID=2743610 RepID=A0A544QX01_9FIRM|nr:ABC transporter ATP-binding protein [Peptacetobacter hominis]TQQ85220.1 ABC transporter ATP-binding protein [Peptacetobacter hominis]